MKANVGLWACAAAVAWGLSLSAEPTKVMLMFDTEDYTCDRSNDAIRDIANVLPSEGVRGNFNVVGFLAARLVELRRFDFAALDVLTTGSERVKVVPREQLGSFRLINQFETFRMANTWVHTPEFKDDYVTDRLRLQLWTLRLE